MLEGALHSKKMQSMKLATRAEGIIRAVKQILQPASIIKLKDVRTGEAVELIGDLHEVRRQYLDLCREIEDIKKEMG